MVKSFREHHLIVLRNHNVQSSCDERTSHCGLTYSQNSEATSNVAAAG
jgi:hypothetical protein